MLFFIKIQCNFQKYFPFNKNEKRLCNGENSKKGLNKGLVKNSITEVRILSSRPMSKKPILCKSKSVSLLFVRLMLFRVFFVVTKNMYQKIDTFDIGKYLYINTAPC